MHQGFDLDRVLMVCVVFCSTGRNFPFAIIDCRLFHSIYTTLFWQEATLRFVAETSARSAIAGMHGQLCLGGL